MPVRHVRHDVEDLGFTGKDAPRCFDAVPINIHLATMRMHDISSEPTVLQQVQRMNSAMTRIKAFIDTLVSK